MHTTWGTGSYNSNEDDADDIALMAMEDSEPYSESDTEKSEDDDELSRISESIMKKNVEETGSIYAVSDNHKHEKSYEVHSDDHSVETMSPSTNKGDQHRETLLKEHFGTWG
ncbi:hypothetical protein H5410_050177 [Solanum commersonii]|uniref:Uncharacterized protein n=1 Tax=Solanum commersonii TaxID=4109 RepID=A0A9J5WX78_SOLCO|nr:hypothetical protein H5410_050177 [Solanum commersonii]